MLVILQSACEGLRKDPEENWEQIKKDVEKGSRCNGKESRRD